MKQYVVIGYVNGERWESAPVSLIAAEYFIRDYRDIYKSCAFMVPASSHEVTWNPSAVILSV